MAKRKAGAPRRARQETWTEPAQLSLEEILEEYRSQLPEEEPAPEPELSPEPLPMEAEEDGVEAFQKEDGQSGGDPLPENGGQKYRAKIPGGPAGVFPGHIGSIHGAASFPFALIPLYHTPLRLARGKRRETRRIGRGNRKFTRTG